MRNNRKGQAALEFLTTYGWAFLVILVMIGALAGFGILSPKSLLPNRCNVGPELACEEAAIWSGDNVTFVLKNSLSDTINIDPGDVDVTFEQTLTHADNACTVDGTSGTPVSISPGTKATFVCPYTVGSLPAAEDKAKLEVAITYTPVGKTLEQQVKGEIFQSVI